MAKQKENPKTWTKAEIEDKIELFKEVYQKLSKAKQMDMLGHANDMYLFLEQLKRDAK